MTDTEEFIYPIGRFHGELTPENILFDANLQEFNQKISYICGLESNGKLTPQEAYEKIKSLWTKLSDTKKTLLP